MKALIITFIAALVINTLLLSLFQTLKDEQGRPWMQPIPAYPWPAAISDVKESGFGLKREDSVYPEIHYTDNSRSTMYMTRISDQDNERNVEFPLGANN